MAVEEEGEEGEELEAELREVVVGLRISEEEGHYCEAVSLLGPVGYWIDLLSL